MSLRNLAGCISLIALLMTPSFHAITKAAGPVLAEGAGMQPAPGTGRSAVPEVRHA